MSVLFSTSINGCCQRLTFLWTPFLQCFFFSFLFFLQCFLFVWLLFAVLVGATRGFVQP